LLLRFDLDRERDLEDLILLLSSLQTSTLSDPFHASCALTTYRDHNICGLASDGSVEASSVSTYSE